MTILSLVDDVERAKNEGQKNGPNVGCHRTLAGGVGLVYERERLERYGAGGGAVRKEKVRHFHGTIPRFNHTGLDLRLQAGAPTDAQPLQPVLRGGSTGN